LSCNAQMQRCQKTPGGALRGQLHQAECRLAWVRASEIADGLGAKNLHSRPAPSPE
jgi:hypothetical protein